MATEETISTIAKALGEVEETPLAQIEGVVRALGDETALAILEETLDIEKNGGMTLADGTRRRSPGGVYFQLARKKLPPEEKKNIFREKKSPSSESEGAAGQGVPESSRLARRRVVEVIPPRAASAAKGARGGFAPPELPSALARARIRQQVTGAIAPLPIEEQYHMLLDLLADIHDRVVGPGEATSAARPQARGVRRK